ncbi:hypothetical protein Gotur_013354 [Gossypium turneri]
MVYVRQTIVSDASCALARAVCIATRYSAVRRQFGSQNGGPETQVPCIGSYTHMHVVSKLIFHTLKLMHLFFFHLFCFR